MHYSGANFAQRPSVGTAFNSGRRSNSPFLKTPRDSLGFSDQIFLHVAKKGPTTNNPIAKEHASFLRTKRDRDNTIIDSNNNNNHLEWGFSSLLSKLPIVGRLVNSSSEGIVSTEEERSPPKRNESLLSTFRGSSGFKRPSVVNDFQTNEFDFHPPNNKRDRPSHMYTMSQPAAYDDKFSESLSPSDFPGEVPRFAQPTRVELSKGPPKRPRCFSYISPFSQNNNISSPRTNREIPEFSAFGKTDPVSLPNRDRFITSRAATAKTVNPFAAGWVEQTPAAPGSYAQQLARLRRTRGLRAVDYRRIVREAKFQPCKWIDYHDYVAGKHADEVDRQFFDGSKKSEINVTNVASEVTKPDSTKADSTKADSTKANSTITDSTITDSTITDSKPVEPEREVERKEPAEKTEVPWYLANVGKENLVGVSSESESEESSDDDAPNNDPPKSVPSGGLFSSAPKTDSLFSAASLFSAEQPKLFSIPPSNSANITSTPFVFGQTSGAPNPSQEETKTSTLETKPGTTEPSITSLFGTVTTEQPPKSLFGTTTTEQPPKSLFGTTTTEQPPKSLFGTTTTEQPPKSLFGTATTEQPATSVFGTTPPAESGSLFSLPARSTGSSLFGTGAVISDSQKDAAPPIDVFRFGSADPQPAAVVPSTAAPRIASEIAQPAFGQTTSSLFCNPASSSLFNTTQSIFGGNAQSAGNAQQQTTSMFTTNNDITPPPINQSTNNNVTSSLFGSTEGGGLFGNNNVAQSQQTSLFGTSQSSLQMTSFSQPMIGNSGDITGKAANDNLWAGGEKRPNSGLENSFGPTATNEGFGKPNIFANSAEFNNKARCRKR